MLIQFTKNDGTPLCINPAFVVAVGRDEDIFIEESGGNLYGEAVMGARERSEAE